MRQDLLDKARGISDRMPLNMNKHNVARLRAIFAYDLAVVFEEIFEQGRAKGKAEMTPPALRKNDAKEMFRPTHERRKGWNPT